MGEWYSLSAGIYGAVYVEDCSRFRVMGNKQQSGNKHTDIWYKMR